MTSKILPLGKQILCHHGHFTLLSEISAVEIMDNGVQFECEDGIYEASIDTNWKIKKISDEPYEKE
jgi:hypothetical protein